MAGRGLLNANATGAPHCRAIRANATTPCSAQAKGPGLSRRLLAAELSALVVALQRHAQAAVVPPPERVEKTAPSRGDEAPRFSKGPSGAKIQEIVGGSGPEAQNGDSVTVEYVLRRSNGYFIYSTVESASFQPRDVPTAPFRFQLGDDKVIAGLQDGIRGMRPGGKRRVLVPPEAGYAADPSLLPQPPTFATKRQLLNHTKEPLLFELQLKSVSKASTLG